MKAMILAAGLGTRLLPYTLQRPKPLFPILNKPLLTLTINRLKLAGFSQIVVNAHHLHHLIKEAVQDEANIILQEEETILGTGGGLRLALHHFGNEPILVVNGDIYHTIDYKAVYRHHCAAGSDVTLVLHDYPRFNDVAVDDKGHVAGFRGPGGITGSRQILHAFTGIHVINPEVMQAIPRDKASCIIDRYRKLLQQGGVIRSYLAAGHFWTDMGTPADYLQLHAGLLKKKAPLYEELAETAAGGPFVGRQKAAIGKDVQLLDWVCLGQGVTVANRAVLQRVVVWDGAVVPAGSVLRDVIVTS